jgi:hypothetical protein
MKISALGYCGLNCEECSVFIATATNDNALRQKTAKKWSQRYAEFLQADLKPEDMHCRGCRSEDDLFAGCQDCPIRTCVQEKDLASCASCAEYESCVMLNGFFSYHHEHAKANLDEMRGKSQ